MFAMGEERALQPNTTRKHSRRPSAVVICDLPFGRRHLEYREVRRLYPRVFRETARILRDGGRALLLTPVRGVVRRLFEERTQASAAFAVVAIREIDMSGSLPSLFELRRRARVAGEGEAAAGRGNEGRRRHWDAVLAAVDDADPLTETEARNLALFLDKKL